MSYNRTVSVIGTGTAYGKPDLAITTIGVETLAYAPEEALRMNNERAERVIGALKQAGIDDADIQSASIEVYGEPEAHPNSGELTGKTKFHVTNSLSVTIRQLDRLGMVMQRSVEMGANRISNVSFGMADATKILGTAREHAVTDARERATALARSFGVELGEVLTVKEIEDDEGRWIPTALTRASAAIEVPIAAGKSTVKLRLHATFSIR